ncbi:hypothetical protein MTO96_022183 [Rhipicephalus appendiculatus]
MLFIAAQRSNQPASPRRGRRKRPNRECRRIGFNKLSLKGCTTPTRFHKTPLKFIPKSCRGESYVIISDPDNIPAYPDAFQLQAPQGGPISCAHHVGICPGNHVAARDASSLWEDKDRGMMPFVVECVQFCCIVVVLFFGILSFIALIFRLIQDSNAQKAVTVGATAGESDVTFELKKNRHVDRR